MSIDLGMLLAAVPPTIAATAALIVALRTSNKVDGVHISLNSRLTQLIEASHAQGMQDERVGEKSRKDAL